MIQPMLANKLATDIKNVSNAIYEVKFDGMRIIAENNGSALGGVLWSRGGNHVNNKFPEIAKQLSLQEQCTLDCELVVFNNNRSDFSLLQKRVHTDNPFLIKRYIKSYPATLMVFDILKYNGEDLTNQTQLERKKLLAQILSEKPNIKLTNYYNTPDSLVNQQIEGIMVKHPDKPYIPGKRNNYWEKCKFNKEGVFHVVSYEEHPNGILMITDEGHRVNCNGHLSQKGKDLLDQKNEFDIEVTYLEKTESGSLRFPSFKRYKL